MSRLVIDIGKDLPHRARPLEPAALAHVFGGCKAQGQPCTAPGDCCQVQVPNGGYVLCYFYRGHGDFVTGYCTTSYSAYGS